MACIIVQTPLLSTSVPSYSIPDKSCFTKQDSRVDFYLNEEARENNTPLNGDTAVELLSFEFETPGACCLSVCFDDMTVKYEDGVERYDLLRDCQQITPDLTQEVFYRLARREDDEQEYVCTGTFLTTAKFLNIEGGGCSSERFYVVTADDSPYVDSLDCCLYLPDLEDEIYEEVTASLTPPQVEELTDAYLNSCTVEESTGLI